MISAKYAPYLAVLLVIALVPTVIHVYAGLDEEDGHHTSQVPAELAGFSSHPTGRREAWGRATFDSHDWFERLYEKDGTRVRLFVGRSFNQKRLYHHPEIALSRGADLAEERIVTLPGDPEMPVHLLPYRNGRGLAAYVLVYDGRFIVDPVANQLRNSIWQLFNPRKPMTLFYVVQEEGVAHTPFADTTAAKVLRNAVHAFQQTSSESN